MRRAATVVLLLVACGDDPKADPLPPVEAPDRNATSEDAGAKKDAGGGSSLPDGSSVIDTTTCKNGVKDGDESDVDCGGVSCAPCTNGKACNARGDCASQLCFGMKCNGDVGCSDGTREAFADLAKFPNIAACSGGWSLPGVLAGSAMPACGRLGGNDSANPTGTGCNVADLCQVGWHVCTGPGDVAAKSGGGGCANASFAADTFYVTRTSGNGSALCEATGANDIFGCGSVGAAPDPATCGVLGQFSSDLCASIPATFACGADGTQEANAVTKTAAANGGALCCRD